MKTTSAVSQKDVEEAWNSVEGRVFLSLLEWCCEIAMEEESTSSQPVTRLKTFKQPKRNHAKLKTFCESRLEKYVLDGKPAPFVQCPSIPRPAMTA